MPAFVHLRLHSEYSIVDGMVRLDEAVAAAAADRMPALAFAKGDYVVLVWEREGKDPLDPSKTYKYNDFDLFRVENGKFKEHWDGAMKNPPRSGGKE